MSKKSTGIVWFRNDLRLQDHPALVYALRNYDSVVPVYILEQDVDDGSPGAAAKWWLHVSLKSFMGEVQESGSRLVLRKGSAHETIMQLVDELGAEGVYWNRRYEPEAIARDTAIKAALEDQGTEIGTFNGALLFEPWQVKTKQGGPYKGLYGLLECRQCIARARHSVTETSRFKTTQTFSRRYRPLRLRIAS